MKTTLGTHFFLRWLDWLARRLAWAISFHYKPALRPGFADHARDINRWIREDYRRWQSLTFGGSAQ